MSSLLDSLFSVPTSSPRANFENTSSLIVKPKKPPAGAACDPNPFSGLVAVAKPANVGPDSLFIKSGTIATSLGLLKSLMAFAKLNVLLPAEAPKIFPVCSGLVGASVDEKPNAGVFPNADVFPNVLAPPNAELPKTG